MWWKNVWFMIFVVLALGTSFGNAATINWNKTTGEWSLSGNWDLNRLPTSSDDAYIANGGTTSISTSAATCSTLYLGSNGNSGTIQMTGGTLATTYQYVGQNGTGNFNQSQGTNSSNVMFIMGGAAGSVGHYTLSGTATLIVGVTVTGHEIIGGSGTGTFDHLSGTHTPYGIQLGVSLGSSGTYNFYSGQLTSANQAVGVQGTGTFTQAGGINNCTGTPDYSGINGTLTLGQNGGTGTYTLSGGQLYAGWECIGYDYGGSGTFRQTGGTNTVNKLYISFYDGTSGTYNLEGGTLITKNINYASDTGPRTANFNFGGGTLQAGAALSVSLPMVLTGTGGDANVNAAGYPVTLSGALTGSGGLNKKGAGTLTLNAVNSFAGQTTVTAGTLVLSSTGTLDGTSIISMNGGAVLDVSAKTGGFFVGSSQTLKGSGKVIGNLTVNGIHAPGNSPGIETIQGNYSLLGQLNVELMRTTAGSGYDQVLLSGPGTYNASLSGSLILDWTGMNGSADTTKLWILKNDTAGTLSGAFSNYINGASLGNYDGHDWYLWYGADSATGNLTGGNDVVIAAVPEPSALFLLTMGGIGLIAFAWRRKSKLS